MKNLWPELIDYAKWTPSPLNTQPWKVKIISDFEAELYYDHSRLIPQSDKTGSLTILCLSMFIDTLSLAANPHGYEVSADFLVDKIDPKKSAFTHFANLKLVKTTNNIDYDRRVLLERRTSRLKYDGNFIDQDVVNELSAIAEKYNHKFFVKSDPVTVKWVMELNKKTVLLDMENKEIKSEFTKWLRLEQASAEAQRDGILISAMNIPGILMSYFLNNFSKFTSGFFKNLFMNFYGGTMEGTTTVGWLQGPFHNFNDYINAGILLNRFWLEVQKHKIYIHPFGSIITNPKAHEAFTQRVSIHENSEKVWILLRLGYSEMPPRSLRLPSSEILIEE